jgi:hypothetical protein
MSNKTQEAVEEKIKMMANFWKIVAMCGGACLFTIILSVITSMITGMIVLKIFLYALLLVSAIFSIITMVTTSVTIYFKVTTLDEKKFREAVEEIAEAIADA